MSPSHPVGVADVGVSEPLPRLREDVELLPKLQWGKHTGLGVLRDPKTREVFVLGEREYLICRSLDGATSFEAIRERLEREFEAPAATEEVSRPSGMATSGWATSRQRPSVRARDFRCDHHEPGASGG